MAAASPGSNFPPRRGGVRQSYACTRRGQEAELRPLLEHLPAGSRLLFIDWPGHGRSEDLRGDSSKGKAKLTVELAAAILLNLLRQLEIDRPIFLGSGFGAAAAIRFAADHPDRTLGLILCQPAGLVPPATAEPFSQTGKRGVFRLLRRTRHFAPAGSAADAMAARREVLRLAALRPMTSVIGGVPASKRCGGSL